MLWDGDLPDDAEALANIERSEQAWAEGWGGVFRVVVDGHVVGGTMVRFADPGVGEAAYFLRQSARGRGLATRALLMVADWGFREHGLMRVFARINPEKRYVGRRRRACRVQLQRAPAPVGEVPGRSVVRLPHLLAVTRRAGGHPAGRRRRR